MTHYVRPGTNPMKRYAVLNGQLYIVDHVYNDPLKPRVFLMSYTGPVDGLWVDLKDIPLLSATEAVKWLVDGAGASPNRRVYA